MKLEKKILNILVKKKLKLSVAESCTGGLIGHRLTQVSGSSNYFLEGLITYSNESKISRLNVKPSLVQDYGAVSKEVALAMAEGIRKSSGANIGLSVYVLGAVIYNLSVSELLGRKFYKKYSIYFVLQKALFVTFSLILYYVIGPEGVLLGIGLSFAPFAIQIYKSFKNTTIDFQLLKTKWRFMANNFLIDLSQVFNGQIDKLIIGPLFGFTLLGNYYLAIQILNLLAIMPENVKKYVLPEDSSGVNTTKIKLLTVCFSVLLALVGIFIVPEIVPIFFPEYDTSLEFIPIISLSIIPTTIYTLYTSQFLAHEKSGYIVITSIVAILILVIGIFTLGNLFGNIGLAFSLVISDTSRALLIFCFSRTQKIKF